MRSEISPVVLGVCLLLGAAGCSSEAAEPGSSDPGAGGGTSSERAPIGKADSLSGSCAEGDVCGGKSKGACWCDEECTKYGDCCSDRDAVCGSSDGCSSDTECGSGKQCTDGACVVEDGRCASAADCADGEQCIAPACQPGGPCPAGYCVGGSSISFDAAWNETVSGSLVAGAKVEIEYDADRLTKCRGDQGGHPAWTIYGNYFASDGQKKSFWVAGHSPDGQTKTPTIVAPPGELEIWFENTSIWGCIGYDSNEGQNYRFSVAPLGG